jgi:hypothetical protein
MPAFNFKLQFAESVANGKKHQTIRKKRKNRPRVGQTAYCFTGMRTLNCRLLRKGEIVKVASVRIECSGVLLYGSPSITYKPDLDSFAKKDGFISWAGMLHWFEAQHGLPFIGDLIEWKP